MRLKNFCMVMGFALFVAVLLAIFTKKIGLAIAYVIVHLLFAFIEDRKSARGQKTKADLEEALKEKYPNLPVSNTEYTIGDKTVVLEDAFIKEALLETISFNAYSSRKEKIRARLEAFYSAVMAGNYELQQYVITKKERVSGNDSPDDYYIHCDQKRFRIEESGYKKCRIDDWVVTVCVRGMPGWSLLIWLDATDGQHMVVDSNMLYAI